MLKHTAIQQLQQRIIFSINVCSSLISDWDSWLLLNLPKCFNDVSTIFLVDPNLHYSCQHFQSRYEENEQERPPEHRGNDPNYQEEKEKYFCSPIDTSTIGRVDETIWHNSSILSSRIQSNSVEKIVS